MHCKIEKKYNSLKIWTLIKPQRSEHLFLSSWVLKFERGLSDWIYYNRRQNRKILNKCYLISSLYVIKPLRSFIKVRSVQNGWNLPKKFCLRMTYTFLMMRIYLSGYDMKFDSSFIGKCLSAGKRGTQPCCIT